MQPVYVKSKVSQNIEVSENIFCLSVECDYNINPGQFFMLRSWGMSPLLSRPISVYDFDGKTVKFLYEVRGKGTELLKGLKPGGYIEMLGPSGNGFDIEKIDGRVAIVTGGIGIAPMLYTAKRIKNASIELFAGFRDKVYVMDSFKPYVESISIATDSGSEGHKGFVTDIFDPSRFDMVLCCGPEIMMKKAAAMCIEKDVPVLVSMESRMACGIGACLTCTCKTKNGNKRTCKDGPVFDGRDVIDNA